MLSQEGARAALRAGDCAASAKPFSVQSTYETLSKHKPRGCHHCLPFLCWSHRQSIHMVRHEPSPGYQFSLSEFSLVKFRRMQSLGLTNDSFEIVQTYFCHSSPTQLNPISFKLQKKNQGTPNGWDSARKQSFERLPYNPSVYILRKVRIILAIHSGKAA